MLINALKNIDDYYVNKFNLPPLDRIAIDNFAVVISQFNILKYFMNTAILVIAGGALILIFSVCASYSFAKLDFMGKKYVYMGILATMMIPLSVTFIPVYVMFANFGLVNTRLGMVVSYLGMIPGTVFLLTSFFKNISNEILDAASMDGAGYFQIIRNVIVPMGMPAIVLVIIFNSIAIWNDFLMPMILLNKMDLMTITVALSLLSNKTVNTEYTIQMAGIFLSILPTIILYAFLQKYIIKGINMGAIK